MKIDIDSTVLQMTSQFRIGSLKELPAWDSKVVDIY